jgi:hypothetical protein
VVSIDPVVGVCGQVLESYLSNVVLGSVVVVDVGVGDVVFSGSLVVGDVDSAGLVDDFLVSGFPVGL